MINSMEECYPYKVEALGSSPKSSTILIPVSSMAEHLTVNQDVGGSSPPPGAKGSVAQLVEQCLDKAEVSGSSPLIPTIKYSPVA